MPAEENNYSTDIKVFSSGNIIEEIKIDKIEMPQEEKNVETIENNALDLMNVLKANTLFKSIEDSEKESTQFKDRS